MARSLAFDLDPMIAGFQAMGIATDYMANNFSTLIDFNGNTGEVSIDTLALVTTAERSLSDPLVAPFVSAFVDVARGGMAVFGSPEEIDRRTALAVPWTVISDLVFCLQGTPIELRNALGIEGATTGDEAASRLRENFPNVPDWMVIGRAADRLIRNPVEAFPPGVFPPGVIPKDEKPPKPAGSTPTKVWDGFIVPTVDAAAEAARCLLNGSWGPIGGQWWGWALGWQVCIDQACAEKVAKLLKGLGGGAALYKALGEVLAAETIAAGIAALSITAGMALAIYGLVLGFNIDAVNWSKGVCIQGNWPVIGGPGAFVWAIAGS